MARSFNGTTSSLVTAALPAGGIAYPFTLVCWYNVANITADHCLIAVTDTAGDNNFAHLTAAGAQTGDRLRATSKNSTSGFAQTSISYSANTWQHAAGVFTSGASRDVYLNGGSSGNDTTNRTPAGLDIISVGRLMSLTPTLPCNGSILFAAIYNIALSAAEVGALCPLDAVSGLRTPVNPRFVRPEALIFNLPLAVNLLDLSGLALTDNSTSNAANPRLIL